ncbi:O-antigen ligase [Clostridium sp. YIM B02551]|uniref:O-antigen ligase family protein n=1 Tax=Clostridium sp. YIM B02551 TaxID=2910679 RepID=UPI001EEB6E06|nr:O-antigen ligase family protein [Clostridium sp. YIM B02551]
MDTLIKGINFINNKFYFKILYLLMSISFVSIVSEVPGLSLLNKALIVWGIILVVLSAITLINEGVEYYKIPLYIFILCSFLLVVFKYRTGENIKIFAVNLIIFFAMLSVDKKKTDKELLKEINVISTIYYVVASILCIGSAILFLAKLNFTIKGHNYGINPIGGGEGNVGLFFNENALGIAAALAIVIGVYLIIDYKKFISKTVVLLTIIPNGIALYLSSGRSGFLMIMMLVFILIFIYAKNIFLRIGMILLAVLAVIGATIKVDNFLDQVLSGRDQLWITAWESIKLHPLTGVGNTAMIPTLTDLIPKLTSRGIYHLPGIEAGGLHNIYIQIATVYGVPMLIIFMCFIFMTFIHVILKIDKLRGSKKLKSTILFSICVGVICVNFFESDLIYIISFISILFWVYLGYLIKLVEKNK